MSATWSVRRPGFNSPTVHYLWTGAGTVLGAVRHPRGREFWEWEAWGDPFHWDRAPTWQAARRKVEQAHALAERRAQRAQRAERRTP